MGKQILGVILLLTLLSTSCSEVGSTKIEEPDSGADHWLYSDLRLLDLDDADDLELDVLAVYARTTDSEIQIRLDFLELDEVPRYDIYLALDLRPGGSTTLPINQTTSVKWDTLLTISAKKGIKITSYNPEHDLVETDNNFTSLITRDPIYDNIVIRLKNQQNPIDGYALPTTISHTDFENMRFMVFITSSDSTAAIDTVGPVDSTGLPPKPAQVLFTFWNSYPSYTPALALRRWDGAHTGPSGGRHGLYNLLRSARNANLPVVLLDLNNPAALTALDFARQIDFLRELDKNQQVILPEAIPASNSLGLQPTPTALERYHNENQRAIKNFNLSKNSFLFSPTGVSAITEWQQSGRMAEKSVVFVPAHSLDPTNPNWELTNTVTTSIYRYGAYRLIPITGYGPSMNIPEQATLVGPAMETRRAMIKAAVRANDNPQEQSAILLLGGELPGSTWGIPEQARATFAYINSRPWNHAMNAYDLLSYKTEALTSNVIDSGIFDPPAIQTIEEACWGWFDAISQAPDNVLTSSAWQYLMSLSAPVYPAPLELSSLRCHYLDQVGVLLHAASWAQEPYSLASCEIDPDRDGEPECLLASSNIYTLFDLDSSSLSYAFYIDQHKDIHQLIGPSSQLITGLSDESSWQFENGLMADPAVISGAFAGDPPDGITLDNSELSFTWTSTNLLQKTFRLLPQGLEVEYDMDYPETGTLAQLALVIDPWNRFTHDWSDYYYVQEIGDHGIIWGLKDGIRVLIESSAESEINTFLDSRESLNLPEDPNRDYPVGHYLPFPMALVEMEFVEDFQVRIEISP